MLVARVVVASILGAFLVACSAPAPQAPPGPAQAPRVAPQRDVAPQAPVSLGKITLGYSSPSGGQAPLFVAMERGLFSKYGLDTELVMVSRNQIQAMMSGSVDFVAGSAEAALLAASQGAEIAMVATLIPTLSHMLAVAPDIDGPEKLRGKKVGISQFGTITHIAARRALEQLGMDPDRDVTYVVLGDVPTRIAAINAGSLHASTVSPPNDLAAKKAGLRILIDLSQAGVEYPSANILTTKATIAERPQVVSAFLKAVVEGIRIFKTERELAIKIFLQYTQTEDREVAEGAVDFAVRSMPDLPITTLSGMRSVAQGMAENEPAALQVDPSTFVDMKPLREIEASGFLSTLSGKRP